MEHAVEGSKGSIMFMFNIGRGRKVTVMETKEKEGGGREGEEGAEPGDAVPCCACACTMTRQQHRLLCE